MNIYEYLRMQGQMPSVMGGALPMPMNAPPGPRMGPQPIIGGNARNPALGAVPFPGQQWKSAGPLAVPQALPPPKGRGFLGAIDDVFGGPDMKNLTPEQQKAARRRGLLAFGAQMLTATDPRGNRAQGLSALGQGVMAGQAGYGQGIEQGMAANQERQRQAMYGALMPQPNESTEQRYNRYLEMFNAALQQGDTEGMKFISQALNTMPKPGDSKAEPLKPPVVRIDPTGKEYFLREPDAQHPYWWKDYTGAEAPPRATAGGAGGPGRLNAVQAKAKSFQESANSAIEDINTVLGSIDPAGKWKAASGPGALGQLIRAGDPNAQLLEGASGLLAEIWLRMTTGAAYNEQEYQNAQNRYLIYPTDSKRMIEWKLNNMKLLQGMLKDIAGASNDTGTESPSDPFSSMDRAAEAE